MYSYTAALNMEASSSPNAFDFFKEPQLLQLRERSFQGKKNKPKPKPPAKPLLVFIGALKEIKVSSTQLLD